MRSHYFQWILNEEGQPVPGVDISVYLAGGTTPAYVYSAETAGTSTNTVPQTTTDANGFFEFWIAGPPDTYSYSNQKFKITWVKAGVIDAGEVDNVEIGIGPKVYTATVEIASWVINGAGPTYSYNLTHNLGKSYPMIISYADSTKISEEITVTSVSEYVSTITKTGNAKSQVTVIG